MSFDWRRERWKGRNQKRGRDGRDVTGIQGLLRTPQKYH